MAGQKTAARRKKLAVAQEAQRLGLRTDRPFLFQVDGGNFPQLRPDESAKSFLKRIKDWEKFTGRTYPKSTELNRLKLRGSGGTKDYTGSNWEDEKQEWVSQYQSSLKINPNLPEEIQKEETLANIGKVDWTKQPVVDPINQGELDTKEKLKNLKNTNTADGKNSVVNNLEKQTQVSLQQEEKKKPAALGTDPYKTDVFTVDPRTGKEVGVITRSKRKELESHLAKNKLKAKRSPGLYIQSTR